MTAALFFVAGLVILVLSSNKIVDAAVRIAQRHRISEMLIGTTLISIGTTLPEVMVSVTASMNGHADMAAGNAIGSIICNTALVAGMVQAIRASKVDYASFVSSYTCFFIVAAVYCVTVWTTGGLSRLFGLALLLMLALYLLYSYRTAIKMREPSAAAAVSLKGSPSGDVAILLLMAFFMFVSARLMVTYGAELARLAGVPEHVISISLIAVGTSLPELITAINAMRRGHAALSIGNIIGANILNLLLVSGLASSIAPISFSECLMRVDLPVMLLVSIMLAAPVFIRKRLYQWQGASLLLVYMLYIFYLYTL